MSCKAGKAAIATTVPAIVLGLLITLLGLWEYEPLRRQRGVADP